MAEPNYFVEKGVPGYKPPKSRDAPTLTPETARQVSLFGGDVPVEVADPEFKKILARRKRQKGET